MAHLSDDETNRLFCCVKGTALAVPFAVGEGAALAAEVLIQAKLWVGRREWIRLGVIGETRGDRVLVEIVATDVVVGGISDAVIGKSSLPDREFGGEAMREAAFDELHRSFEGEVGWSDDEVEMVGHDDVGVE